MNIFLRLILILMPIMFFSFFYLYINDDDYYPGADFRVIDMPKFEINDLYKDQRFTHLDLEYVRKTLDVELIIVRVKIC